MSVFEIKDNILVKYNGKKKNVIISDKYDGKVITTIGTFAFNKCEYLKSVIIPNTVNTIENYAFYNCSSLKSIIIPNSVKIIGDYAFGCTSLASIEIPNSVTSIGNSAFSGCTSLASIEIPNSVTSIGDNAFYNSPIETATIPTIACSYIKNSKLKTVVVTSGASIEQAGFSYCTSLTSITIPNSVTSIGDNAFYNCSSLKSFIIPNSVKIIGDSTFEYCSSLRNITIPNTVTSIGNNAFFGCRSLKNIEIPNSVTSIGDNAFHNCSSLTNITIPNSVTSIGNDAFYNSPIETATIPAIACSYIKNSKLKTVFVTSGESIEQGGFFNCTSLTSIIISNSVTSIGNNAFYNSPIETATIPAIACSYIKNSKLKTVVVTSGESIEQGGFSNCTSLTSIIIPNSVTSIGKDAFFGCTSLASIEIPNSVKIIGDCTFGYCSSLRNITIPNSVTSIGTSIFYYCESLTINCEAKSKPQGWSNDWIDETNVNCTINWGIENIDDLHLSNKTEDD